MSNPFSISRGRYKPVYSVATDEMWRFIPRERRWEAVSTTVGKKPGPRADHGAAAISTPSSGPILMIFGGVDERNQLHHSIHLYHVKWCLWTRPLLIGIPPPMTLLEQGSYLGSQCLSSNQSCVVFTKNTVEKDDLGGKTSGIWRCGRPHSSTLCNDYFE